MTALSLFDDGPCAPCPARFNMAAHTFAPAALTPDRIALDLVGAPGEVLGRWTHGEMADAVRRTAAGLAARGLDRGDRVLLRLGNSADFPILFFAAIALGAIPVPTSSQLTPYEIATILADLDPALVCLGTGLTLPPDCPAPVLAQSEMPDLLSHAPRDFADTAADDPAFMVYTSGTGGRPKGVVHAHHAAWARRMMWDGWYGLTPDDRILHAGAFNWTYTLGAGLTDPWAIGATAIIHAGPAARDLWPALAAAHRATIFAAVPGVYRQMLGADLATGFRNLRHGLSAGEALHPAVAEAWSAATGKPIFQALGMSEISTYISVAPDRPPRHDIAGWPQPGRRIAILGEDPETGPVPQGTDGLLAVSRRDPGLMLGYWRRPEETEAAFRGEWFLTGDRARMDEDGALHYLGRADDVMNAGGFRVNPAEVEAALQHHPGVAEAAAVDLPVKDGVSIIAAFYVPKGAPVAPEALAAHCATELAAYKCPRLFRAVEALPRSANGKILRRQLKETPPS
jgi:acyl-coenzyme A synthetase/AMP-(fatty) acid ligase